MQAITLRSTSMLIQEQGKLGEVVEALDSDMGKAIQNEEERALLKAETLVNVCGLYGKSVAIYIGELRRGPNQLATRAFGSSEC